MFVLAYCLKLTGLKIWSHIGSLGGMLPDLSLCKKINLWTFQDQESKKLDNLKNLPEGRDDSEEMAAQADSGNVHWDRSQTNLCHIE